MHTQPISNQNFGRIYLIKTINGTNYKVPAKPLGVNKLYSDIYKAPDLIDGVQDNDFDTLELRSKYNKLIDEQIYNPVDIDIDLWLDHNPEPEDFFQKAIVNYREKVYKVFKQAVIWNPKVDKVRPTTIEFLEKACTYANELAKELH